MPGRASKKPPATKKKPAAKKPAAKAKPSAAFEAVARALADNPGIVRRRMFGADGLGIGKAFFAMEWKGNLVVKLPADVVAQLVAAKTGVPFDPGMGRPMREWLQVAPGATDWLRLAERALAYVASLAD